MNLTKHIIILSILLIYQQLKAQKFESIDYTQWSGGVMQWNDRQMLVYGTGLTWIDMEGNILHQMRLLEGISSSTVIDALPDGQGGAWILTNNSLARISSNKEITPILDRNAYPKLDTKELGTDKKGNIYCLTKTRVFRVFINNSYELIPLNESDENYYFKHFDIADDGSILISSYGKVYLIEKGIIKEYSLEKKTNIQDVACVDGHKIIVDYRDIYELKGGELITFIKGRQIANGIKFYTSHFKSINDFWLYSNGGNAFHNDQGNWVNYIPPENLKTGNFGEHLYRCANNDIWMTLKGQVILRFNGNQWSKINLDKKLKIPAYRNAFQAGDKILTQEKSIEGYMAVANGEVFKSNLPEKKLVDIKNYEASYFSDDEGLKRWQSGTESLVHPSNELSSFGKIGEEWVFIDGNKMYTLLDGQTKEVSNNDHYLGWESLQKVKIFDLHTGELAFLNPKRGDILSIYSGNGIWKKLTSVDGHKLGRIRDVFRHDSTSIIVSQKGDFISYDGNKLSFIRKNENKTSHLSYYPIPASDQSVWSYHRNLGLTVYRNNEVNEYPLSMEGVSFAGLRIVLPITDNEYHLIFDSDIIKCSF